MSEQENQDLGVDILNDGGIYKKILVEGTGDLKPTKGSDVEVHYVGTLTDGTKFDSSRDRGEPFTFELGKGRVIKGWDEGVKTMRKGEKAIFTLRSDYAYGDSGSPPKIPPKATLVFEVELLSWVSEKDVSFANDGGILKTIISDGEGMETPKDDDQVRIKIKGSLEDGTVFQLSDELKVVLGEEHLPDGVERAITTMTIGEHSQFKIQSSYGYGEKGNEEKNVPPNSTLLYDITLISFIPEKNSWEMCVEEKFHASNKRRLEGNEFFKQGKYEKAMKKYQKALGYVNSKYDFKTDEEKAESNSHRVPILLNLAQVNMKQKIYTESINYCSQVLETDPNNVKAFFRRGQAYMNSSEFDLASKDYEKARELDPNNKEILNHIALLKKKVKEQEQKDKKLYSNMFSAIGQ